MRRATDIKDDELRAFCERFKERFHTTRTRAEWFLTSLEGHTHVPVRDLRDLLRRMERLNLVSATSKSKFFLLR